MNRRQFIKRAGVLIGALMTGASDLLRRESVTDRLSQFGQAIAAQKAERSRESEYFLHYPIKDDVERILAANPETSREDAFLQAVIEKVEKSLGKTIWVNESQDGPGSDDNDGLSPEMPLKTRQAAIDKVDCPSGYYLVRMGGAESET